MSEEKEKWSWDAFKIKTFCWRNFIWLISTVLVFLTVFLNRALGLEKIAIWIIIGIWGILSVILVLHKAFEKAVGNAEIKANLSAAAQLNADTAKIIEAAKGTG
jgi:uncharacterized membrane protein